MSRRMILVALREYVENLRTKTFWIGILAFPATIVIAGALGVLFAKARDVQAYAVLDQSGWLLAAVDERADREDLRRLLEAARDASESAAAALPAPLKPLAPALAGATDEQLGDAARALAARDRSAADAAEARLPTALGAAVRDRGPELARWLRELTPEEARRAPVKLERADYRRVSPNEAGSSEDELRRELDEGRLFAYFVIGPDPVAGSQGNKYVSNRLMDQDLRRWLTEHADEEVRARRFAQTGVSEEVARHVQEPVKFEGRQVGAGGEERGVEKSDAVRHTAPMVFVYLLWICILISANMLLTNTIEEKSNRIIEVLLSSVSPLELMCGKILGIALTGLTVVGSWVLCFVGGIAAFTALVPMPPGLDLAGVARNPLLLGSFVAYFLLGYLFYAALLVAIGSVCNTIKEAQGLMTPVTLLMMVPLIALVPVGRAPNGTLAKILSFFPPATPFVMMNRAAGPPAIWEYAATTVLMLVSIVAATWMAAKIFRVGVLMTGKPPKLSEMLRWIGTPVSGPPRSH